MIRTTGKENTQDREPEKHNGKNEKAVSDSFIRSAVDKKKQGIASPMTLPHGIPDEGL